MNMTTKEKFSGNRAGTEASRSNGTGSIKLNLTISDSDLFGELSRREEPRRSEFALAAMKVGVIAFRQAQGQVDAHQIRNAGERVISDMHSTLEKHQQTITQQVGDCIRSYFDPKSGMFSQCVRALVGQGGEPGELERIIRHQIDGNGSALANTLAAHVGSASPLMRILDPQSTSGLVSMLA